MKRGIESGEGISVSDMVAKGACGGVMVGLYVSHGLLCSFQFGR